MLSTASMRPATAGRFHRWQASFRNTARSRFAGRRAQRPGIREPGGSGDEGNGGDGNSGGAPSRPRASRMARWQSMLIIASLASFFGALLGACFGRKKRGKKGRTESSSTISHENPKMMPLEAYFRGSSKKRKLPKRGKLRRWRANRLKEQAKKLAEREKARVLKRYKEQFRKEYADCKLRTASFGFDILSEDYKRIVTRDMSGAKNVHYEYWILWKKAYCKYHYQVGAILRRERQETPNPNYNELYIRR